MAKPTRKTLPKEFGDILKRGDMTELAAVFEKCLIEARGGYSKRTALGFTEASDEALTWLLAQGADLQAADLYGDTPLHNHAGSYGGKPKLLLDAGAAVDAVNKKGDTPLHAGAGAFHVEHVALLLSRRADPDAVNESGLTPLGHAMQRCSNTQLDRMARIAELLLQSGAGVSDKIPEFVRKAGEQFEFHRAGFAADIVDQMSDGLETLYAMFDVTPVPRRVLHDGVTDIVLPEGNWKDQHQALWDMLVPSSGAAQTVQGEVVRIAGRIAHELDGNGAINWSEDYQQMVAAFLEHVSSGVVVADIDVLREELRRIKSSDGATRLMFQKAVEWVGLNRAPVALPKPGYGI